MTDARPRLGIPRRAWATFLAVVTAGPATVALVFTLWPGLRPDPGDHLAAEMQAVTVDPDVPYGDFLHYVDAHPAGVAAGTRRAAGAVVYLKITVHGRKHRNLDLFYSIYHARTRARYRGETVSRSPASYFRADTPDDAWIATVWVPNPPAFDRVFVRLELYDHGSMLAVADTRPFRFPQPSLDPSAASVRGP
jgi:hypothetical protein